MRRDDLLAKGYSRLPPWLQSGVASLRGLVLNRQRYGRDTARLVREAVARESFSSKDWATYQAARLRKALTIARHDVPLYRNLWAGRTDDAWLDLNEWPVLDKEQLRQSPDQVLSDKTNRSHLFSVHTSGTTGKPLTLWRSRQVNIEWHALFEARWRNWYGVSRRDRWAILGGQIVVPYARKRAPYWVWNMAMRQLYCSVYHLTTSTAEAYAAALCRYQVTYLLGYTSALTSLARFALEQDLKLPALKVVIANAEPVSPHQRQIMERAFGCPVRITYGMAEIAAGAGECEHGVLHWWPEASILEVCDDAGKISRSGTGELLATSLLNFEMPPIRYRVGDRVRLSQHIHECRCSRSLPVIESVEGRTDDLIITPEQRIVGRLDPVFKGTFDIKEAQIVQTGANQLEVRYVTDSADVEMLEESLRTSLKKRVGEMHIAFRRLDRIPVEQNGKFRAVINEYQRNLRQNDEAR